MNLLIIADDLSGAADCAIGFASAGLPTVVTLDPSRDTGAAQVIAADTDSRRLAPEAAAQRALSTFKTLLKPGQRLYKKIDSTLRGNWAAEVAALQTLAGLAIVAPAFPATGRTTLDGRVWVNGQPLESTDTWQLEHAGRCADIDGLLATAGLRTAPLTLEILRGDVQALAEQILAAAHTGVQALIVDAQTAQDLRILARVTLDLDQPLYWVGSGGLAREIAQLAGLSEAASEGPPPAAHAPILALVGSLSEVCQRQCELLKARADIDELIVPPEVLRQGVQHAQWANWQSDIGQVLEQRRDLLLRIGRDQAFDPAEGVHLSEQLAAMVAPHFGKLGGLVATGGETARAMLGAVGIGSLQLLAEVEAGVAFGRPVTSGHCPGIVTKAGAFGTDHALYAAWLHLHGLSEALAVANI